MDGWLVLQQEGLLLLGKQIPGQNAYRKLMINKTGKKLLMATNRSPLSIHVYGVHF